MRENRPKHRGDRKDGYRLPDLDPMHIFMPYLLQGRTENEAVLSDCIPLEEAADYLKQKNAENPEFHYTLFQLVCTALAKTMVLRPAMNRFICGHRIYQHKDITFAFVVKKQFSDDGKESMARIVLAPDSSESPLENFRAQLQKIIFSVRKENKQNGTDDIMQSLTRLPRWMLRIAVKALRALDYYGKLPDSLWKQDPYHSSIFISNIGSLHMDADYHHLTDWGTNSFFVLLGEMKKHPFFREDGTVEMKESVNISFTIDERIADGIYFANSIRMFRNLLQHPEQLELPLQTQLIMEE